MLYAALGRTKSGWIRVVMIRNSVAVFNVTCTVTYYIFGISYETDNKTIYKNIITNGWISFVNVILIYNWILNLY